MKNTNNLEKNLNWLNNQIEKDSKDLETEKLSFVNEIKKINKKNFFTNKKEKSNLWQKIRRSLTGF